MAAAESVLFEMAVGNVRSLPLGFAEKATEIARQTSGRLLFEIRLDGDAHYQRVAAISYARGEIGILVLDKDGASVRSSIAGGGFASFIEPLECWSNLPLRDQANNDIRGHAILFIAALRNAGCAPLR
ncbi:hypothetical protein [Mesorhizobium sp. B2-4-6]|uniref:hypothetical protein n=2 Tax=unclassified Mesorhizobium TaxID=325217 RepID=UPI00112E874E|nr:hypothetical protein [Mesorhizobium sp. B2-4-6]TPI09408.1 hypothetical protein FJW10_30210 [Mesorhizobium sp. B4-1-1]TPL32921.1 hypothetical protein FJ957_31565 [Mesorhizobium sp. B2-4-6]